MYFQNRYCTMYSTVYHICNYKCIIYLCIERMELSMYFYVREKELMRNIRLYVHFVLYCLMKMINVGEKTSLPVRVGLKGGHDAEIYRIST